MSGTYCFQIQTPTGLRGYTLGAIHLQFRKRLLRCLPPDVTNIQRVVDG